MLQTLHAGRSSIQDIVSLTPPTTPNQIHPNQTPSSPAKTPASALTETHNIARAAQIRASAGNHLSRQWASPFTRSDVA